MRIAGFWRGGHPRAVTDPVRAPRQPQLSPRQGSDGTRRRPSDERAALMSATRVASRLAGLAIVLAAVALALAVWHAAAPPGPSCQEAAWGAEPAPGQLPGGWAVKGTTFDVNRRTTQFAGPDPGDGTGAPNVLATATCFAEGAADAVSRSAAAARAIGQVVAERPDLSDGGFEATDVSGAMFLEFRRGEIVVDLAASGGATPADIDTVASALDRSLGGDGGRLSSPGAVLPGASSATAGPSASAAASASPAAPELEKLLPAMVGKVELTIDSAVGSTVLQDDQGSRAITAALRAEGKGPDALRLAEAYDASQSSDLNILAVRVDGMAVAKTRQLVLDSWLAASGAGVRQTQATIGGREYTKVDLGDGGPIDYVRASGDVVFVITTSDPALAGEAATLLP